MTLTSGQLANGAAPAPISPRPVRWLPLGLAALILAAAAIPLSALQYKMNVLGFGVCQQIMRNTFTIAGSLLPVGARCSGIYLGLLLGVALLHLLRPRAGRLPTGSMVFVVALMFATMVADGFNSAVQNAPGGQGIWLTTNPVRMVTGALAGLALAFVLYPSFNRSFWRRDGLSKEHSLESPFELFGYGVAILVPVALTISSSGDQGAWAVYWLIALGSIVGLLIMMTMTNMIAITLCTRRSGNVTSWQGAALPLLIALSLAIIEIVGLAFIREQLVLIVGGVPAGMPTVPGLR